MKEKEASQLEKRANHLPLRIVCPNCRANFPLSLSTYPGYASIDTVPPFLQPEEANELETKTFVEGPSWKQICPYCHEDVLFIARVPALLVRAERQRYWTSKQGKEDRERYQKIKNKEED